MSIEQPPIETDPKSEIRKVEIIIKIPEAIIKNPEKETREEYKKAEEIYNAWHNKGIAALMEVTTEAENKITTWFSEHKNEEIDEEQKANIEEYKRATSVVNARIEEVYGEMDGVEIKDTKVAFGVKEF